MRTIFCFLLLAIVAVSAITVKPFKAPDIKQFLSDVDGQGHENAGDRVARGHGGGGYYGGGNYGHGHGGFPGHGGGHYHGGHGHHYG